MLFNYVRENSVTSGYFQIQRLIHAPVIASNFIFPPKPDAYATHIAIFNSIITNYSTEL